MNKVGKLLVLYRTMNDLNQRDLAKEIGVLPSTMCRLENGKAADQYTMVKIINWMFSGSDKRRPSNQEQK